MFRVSAVLLTVILISGCGGGPTDFRAVCEDASELFQEMGVDASLLGASYVDECVADFEALPKEEAEYWAAELRNPSESTEMLMELGMGFVEMAEELEDMTEELEETLENWETEVAITTTSSAKWSRHDIDEVMNGCVDASGAKGADLSRARAFCGCVAELMSDSGYSKYWIETKMEKSRYKELVEETADTCLRKYPAP